MKSRKLQRLANYDYTTPGLYFVTINVKDCSEYLSKIENKILKLSRSGEIVKQQWKWLEENFNYIKIDEYIVMPDHFHGLIEIQQNKVRNGLDRSLLSQSIKPLYTIIGAFKTTSSILIHKTGKVDFKWQKSFYDRIVRKNELIAIRKYIRENPLNYNQKEFFWSK